MRSSLHHDGQDTTTWFSQEGDVTFGMDSLYYQQPSQKCSLTNFAEAVAEGHGKAQAESLRKARLPAIKYSVRGRTNRRIWQ